jgi:hypothetical protein
MQLQHIFITTAFAAFGVLAQGGFGPTIMCQYPRPECKENAVYRCESGPGGTKLIFDRQCSGGQCVTGVESNGRPWAACQGVRKL